MTKILSTDEMLAAARESGMPETDSFIRAIETISTALAHSLAAHLKIDTNYADFQPGFGGTCAPFFPASEGQACPDAIDAGDVGGDWEERSEHVPATPANVPATLAAALSYLASK